MKLLIVHLSDAHFSTKRFFADLQTRAMVAALFSCCAAPDAVVIILSGDIADKGKVDDYVTASAFLNLFMRLVNQTVAPANVYVLTVPGNHDLTDDVLGEAGDVLANDVLQNKRDLGSARNTYQILLSGQENYWAFDNRWSIAPAKSLEEKIFRQVEVKIDSLVLQFGLFNTAFLSRRHEVQGRLWFPTAVARSLTPRESSSDTLSVGVFHHPYGWLESNNAVAFRQVVEAAYDIALNGHQHTPESYYANSLHANQTWYSAGAALLGDNATDSGFTVIGIDTEARTRRLISFRWNQSLYLPTADTEDQTLSSLTDRKGISLTEDFSTYLDDPESLISNTQKKVVLLPDVYETPRLRGGESRTGSTTRIYSAAKISEILKENEATFIFGETLSGKTCLSKDIFHQLFRRDGSSLPLLLSARDLETSKVRDIERWCNRAVRAQYRGISAPEYHVIGRNRKIAIVDDWHSLALSEPARRVVMKELCARHKHTILLCDSWYQAQELAGVLDNKDPLIPKNHFVILPLSAYQRSNIARRWVSLGRPDDLSDSDFIFKVDEAEKYLDELNRSRLMPPYPLYILSALQTLQGMNQSEPDLGAQGVLFDILIGDKLTAMSEDAPELDINRQFLAVIAHDIFLRSAKGCTLDRLRELDQEFLGKFAVVVKLEPLLRLLAHHKVFYVSDAFYSFRHRYMYYYFVAEHFVSALAKRGTREATFARLKEMAEFLAYEEYAQILMFVIYKTRNEDLIDDLIGVSQKVFSNVISSDLESDIAFANRLDIPRPELTLGQGSVARNREERRLEMAVPDESVDLVTEEDPSRRIEYSNELDWAAKLQFAFKTTQMLGRVLRNFPGTLDADQKRQLAVNASGASLRLLRDILQEAEKDQEKLRDQLSRASDGTDILTATERFQQASSQISALIVLCSYAIVRFISTAVGSSKLGITYDEIRDTAPITPSVLLVDMAIRLENFRTVPVEHLFELGEALKENFIAYEILRMLVWQRVTYLPLDDRKLRARICGRFRISSSSTPVLMANASGAN